MTRIMLLLVLLLPAAAPLHAQDRDNDRRRAGEQARRDSLEAEVLQRFVARLTRDLKLNDSQRAQTERVLKASSARRRELTHESSQLRGRIFRALRADDTSDAEFTRLLAEHEALRTREHDLWRQDQEALAGVLTVRQRAHFLLSWTYFQETMREIMSQRSRRDHHPHPL